MGVDSFSLREMSQYGGKHASLEKKGTEVLLEVKNRACPCLSNFISVENASGCGKTAPYTEYISHFTHDHFVSIGLYAMLPPCCPMAEGKEDAYRSHLAQRFCPLPHLVLKQDSIEIDMQDWQGWAKASHERLCLSKQL